MAQVIITFEGREFTFDRNAIGIDEWRELKRKYGMTPRQFDNGIDDADPDASTFMYWLMLRQEGDHRTPLGDNLKPDIIALNSALSAGVVIGEGAPEDEPDPTQGGSPPATKPPKSSDSSTETLMPSATSTSSASAISADSSLVTSDS